jgi:lipopolysaccharide transport system ATP-binding protein
MAFNVLTVEGLSKKYRRERTAAGASEEFWALRDVSLSLEEGTRLGVIGSNGAGKSTLLKILSRVTGPTTGRIEIFGRTASLLEVGTGFHPELTGRENIYLNGALLGMSRPELRRKLDEIVAFAEVEEFLDEPVKHYSSGMYVRLGFAIAAHVDPEILILDEVLAVGDFEFQRKCFGKMEELGKSARSVIFVSHDLAAVASLCNRCLVLDAGRVVFDGPTASAIATYYGRDPYAGKTLESAGRTIGDANARLLSAQVVDDAGKQIIEARIDQPFRVRMSYWLSGSLQAPAVPNFHFHTAEGMCAFIGHAPNAIAAERGEYVAEMVIPGEFLNEGMYSIGIALTTYIPGHVDIHFYERGALMINIRDPRQTGGLREAIGYGGKFPGAVRPQFQWEIRRLDSR